MKILVKISPEHYDRLLSGVSESLFIRRSQKRCLLPTKAGTGAKMIEIFCEKFHARMLRALAENFSPQAVPQIEKAIRLSRMYH
jgi:hypothetical protein